VIRSQATRPAVGESGSLADPGDVAERISFRQPFELPPRIALADAKIKSTVYCRGSAGQTSTWDNTRLSPGEKAGLSTGQAARCTQLEALRLSHRYDSDVCWVDDALFRPEVRNAYRRLVEQGWTDALRVLHPGERIYTFWKYFRNAFVGDAGLRIDHLLRSPALVGRPIAGGVDREGAGT
jgi:hypothetical protein